MQSQNELVQNINRIQSSVLAVFKDSLPGLFQSRPAGPDGSEATTRTYQKEATVSKNKCIRLQDFCLVVCVFVFHGSMEGKPRKRSNNEGS